MSNFIPVCLQFKDNIHFDYSTLSQRRPNPCYSSLEWHIGQYITPMQIFSFIWGKYCHWKNANGEIADSLGCLPFYVRLTERSRLASSFSHQLVHYSDDPLSDYLLHIFPKCHIHVFGVYEERKTQVFKNKNLICQILNLKLTNINVEISTSKAIHSKDQHLTC